MLINLGEEELNITISKFDSIQLGLLLYTNHGGASGRSAHGRCIREYVCYVSENAFSPVFICLSFSQIFFYWFGCLSSRRQPHSFFVYKWNISRSLKMKFWPCDGFTKLCQNGELFSIKILTLNGLLSFRTTLNLLKINSLHFAFPF